ncbi:glycine-rich domain-containing protein [Streptomyces sp. NPDC127110]|uniref:glycine-rich domain-containing protein n=1 Tax=Streptomyces sp. NPDC127110 TaxID=3345362 RepID=UPI00362B08E5
MSFPPPPPCRTKPHAPPTPALADAQFDAVRATVLDDNPGMEPELAARIVTEALKFVATAARGADDMTPSRLVDKGWHALILHTALYKQLCAHLGGFVDHYPSPQGTEGDLDAFDRTIRSIERAGFAVDRQLWDERTSVLAGER